MAPYKIADNIYLWDLMQYLMCVYKFVAADKRSFNKFDTVQGITYHYICCLMSAV